MLVLLVEDNDDDALIATWAVDEVNERLRARNLPTADVLHQRDAVDGLEAGIQRRPHLVITDVSLPGASGLELLRKLKANPATMAIPVAVLSSSDALVDVRSAYEYQAAVYLTKPDNYADLVEMLTVLLSLYAIARHP